MSNLPGRASGLFAAVGSAFLGGALVGLAEAARSVVGGRLFLSNAQTAALLTAAVLSCALLGAVAVVPLGALPARPIGRTRWSGFLVGVATPLLARVAVWWFSDPPPFTDPLPGQGNPAAFAGVAFGVLVVLVVLYQAIRGASRVAGAGTAIAVGLAGWVLAAPGGPGTPTKRVPAGSPNVLLVTLDTTRADHIGAYGSEVDTRYFDTLAKGGALFLDASAVAAVTGPSHATMLSGSGPWDHGVLLNGVPIPRDRTMLAETLHEHGWNTGAFVSSYVLDGNKGFDRGFEVYDDDFGWLKGGDSLVFEQLLAMIERHFNPEDDLERRGSDTVDAALDWYGHQEGSTFLWVHLFDAHGPYEPPPPFDTRYYQGDPKDPSNQSMGQVQNVAAYLKKSLLGITDLNWVLAQYDGEVSYADAQLGRLVGAIDTKNTIVVVIGDHGESFGEHGVWFNHGDDVYETSLHVPFALRWPGHIAEGVRVEQPFGGDELAPTILDALGIEAPASMTATSAAGLVGVGKGQGAKLARSMCFDREANVADRAAGKIDKPQWRMAGVRDAAGRYVERETGRPAEYFDLTTDVRGLTDVINLFQQSPDGATLLKLYEGQAQSVLTSDATKASAIDVGDEERKRLEALGYLDATDAEGAPPAGAAPAAGGQ